MIQNHHSNISRDVKKFDKKVRTQPNLFTKLPSKKQNAKSRKEKDLCQTTKPIWRFFGKINHLWINERCWKRTKSIGFIISDKFIRFQFDDFIVVWFATITTVTTIIGNIISNTIDCINQSEQTICNRRKCKLRGWYNLNLISEPVRVRSKNWSENRNGQKNQAKKVMKSSTKFFKKNFFNVTFTSFECLRPVGQLIACWP